jgi:hypothetical protein
MSIVIHDLEIVTDAPERPAPEPSEPARRTPEPPRLSPLDLLRVREREDERRARVRAH